MKPTLLLLAALLGLSQRRPTDPVRQQLGALFYNLDHSQVPTGRLLEAAVPLGPVASFDGLLRDSACAARNGLRPSWLGRFFLPNGLLI